MARRQRPHWQAPTTIITALVCAVLFAVGHHVFYSSLNGKAAHGNVYNILGSDVSAQQLNIAGGTALAFLVKAALGVALSLVFIQVFWQSIKSRSSQDVTLQTLDTIFDGLNNVFTLLKAWVWWRYPLLFILALVAWCVLVSK